MTASYTIDERGHVFIPDDDEWPIGRVVTGNGRLWEAGYGGVEEPGTTIVGDWFTTRETAAEALVAHHDGEMNES